MPDAISKIGNERLAKYNPYIEQAAKLSGVSQSILRAITLGETANARSIEPDSAVSKAGAIGPMQLMPETAAGLGVDPYIPEQNIKGGAQYYASLLKKYEGDKEKALAAYNAGPGRVDSLIDTHGDAWKEYLPDETKNYIPKIIGFENELISADSSVSAQQMNASAITDFVPQPGNTLYKKYRDEFPQYNDMPDGELISRIWKKSYSDMEFRDFLTRFDAKYKQAPERPDSIIGSAVSGVERGWWGMVGSVASSYDWVTGENSGLARTIEGIQTRYPKHESINPITDVDSFIEQAKNPHFWADIIGSTIPFTVAAGAVGAASGVAVGSAAAGMGLSAGARALSSTLGAGLGSGMFEAMTEAGNARQDMLDQGKSEQEADEAANKVFAGNAVVNSVINAMQFGSIIKKMGVPVTENMVKSGAKGVAKELAKQGLEEYTQESLQQLISNTATGRPWYEGLAESGMGGLASGIFFGASGEIVARTYNAGKELAQNTPTPPITPPGTPQGTPPVVTGTQEVPPTSNVKSGEEITSLKYTGKYLDIVNEYDEAYLKTLRNDYLDTLTKGGSDGVMLRKLAELGSASGIKQGDIKSEVAFLWEILEQAQEKSRRDVEAEREAVKNVPKNPEEVIAPKPTEKPSVKVVEEVPSQPTPPTIPTPKPTTTKEQPKTQRTVSLKLVNSQGEVYTVDLDSPTTPSMASRGLTGMKLADVSDEDINAISESNTTKTWRWVSKIESYVLENIRKGGVPFLGVRSNTGEEYQNKQEVSALHAVSLIQNMWNTIYRDAAMHTGNIKKEGDWSTNQGVNIPFLRIESGGASVEEILDIARARSGELSFAILNNITTSTNQSFLISSLIKAMASARKETPSNFLAGLFGPLYIDKVPRGIGEPSAHVATGPSGASASALYGTKDRGTSVVSGVTSGAAGTSIGATPVLDPNQLYLFTEFFSRFFLKEQFLSSEKDAKRFDTVSHPEVTTIAHEFIHLYESIFTEEQWALVLQHFGIKGKSQYLKGYTENGVERSYREDLARAFEKYLIEGSYSGKDKGLKKLFKEMKEALINLYHMIKRAEKSGVPGIRMSRFAIQLFDSIVDADAMANAREEVAEQAKPSPQPSSPAKVDLKPVANDFLSKYGEKSLGGSKILGHIERVIDPDEVTNIANKLTELGYEHVVYHRKESIPDVEGGTREMDIYDVFYYNTRSESRARKAIKYGIKLAEGTATKRDYEAYINAKGASVTDAVKMTSEFDKYLERALGEKKAKEKAERDAEREREKEMGLKKLPRGNTTEQAVQRRTREKEVSVMTEDEASSKVFGKQIEASDEGGDSRESETSAGFSVRRIEQGNRQLEPDPETAKSVSDDNADLIIKTAKNPTLDGIRAIYALMGDEGVNALKKLVERNGKKDRKLDTVLQEFAVQKNRIDETLNKEKESEVSTFIENNQDAINYLTERAALWAIARETRDPEERNDTFKKLESLEKKMKSNGDLSNRVDVLETGIANDSDRSKIDLVQGMPIPLDKRMETYEELGLTKEEGDALNDDELSDMLEVKYRSVGEDPTLYWDYRGIPSEDAKEMLYQSNRFGMTADVVGKELGLDKEGRTIAFDKAKFLAFAPQVLSRLNKHFERVFRMVTDASRIRNKFVTDIIESESWVQFILSSDDIKKQVFTILRDGTTYGAKIQMGVVGPKPEAPWSQRNIDEGRWFTKERLQEMLDNGMFNQTDVDQIAEQQRQARSDWAKSIHQWNTQRQKVGKVFSRDELTQKGYSSEAIDHYYKLLDINKKVVDKWKRSAIANGMNEEKANEMFSLTGYWNLDRGEGQWVMMFEDPTSPTGYAFQRYRSYKDAVSDYNQLVSERKVNPSDEKSKPRRFKEGIASYAPYMSLSQLQDLIEESGLSVTDIESRLSDPNITPEEKTAYESEREVISTLLNELKKRTYSGARTIHRNNSNMIINPKEMVASFENFVWKTGNRYARAITSKELDGMVRDMDDGHWKEYAHKYVRFSFDAKNIKDSKFWESMRNIGYLYGVASNVSNALLNSTQPLYTTVPFLHTWGVANVPSVMAKASASALSYVFKGGSIPRSIASQYPGLENAIEELKSRAVIAPSLNEEIVGSTGQRGFMDWATLPQSASEKHNRALSAVAGYISAVDHIIPNARGNRATARKLAEITDLTEKELESIAIKIEPSKVWAAHEAMIDALAEKIYNGNLSQDETQRIATEFARETSDDTQFVFGKHNYPMYIRSMGSMSAAAKAGYLFKGFQNGYVGFLYANVKNDNKGKSIPYALIPTATKVILFMPLMLLSGISGLPFAGDLKELLKTLGIGDVDHEIRQLVDSPELSNFIIKGMPSVLPQSVAFDISTRAGVGQVLPNGTTSFDYGKVLTDLFGGVPYEIISKVPEGIKDISAGDYTVGFRKVLPVVAQNLIKSVLEQGEGAKSSKGYRITSADDISAFQRVIQGIGFKPLSVAVSEDLSRHMMWEQQEQRNRTSNFNKRLAIAISKGNASDVQDVLEEIIEWNSKQIEPSKIYRFKDQMPSVREQALGRISSDIYEQNKYSARERAKLEQYKEAYGVK